MTGFYIAIPSPTEMSVICVNLLTCTQLDFRHRFPSVVRCKIDAIECDVSPVTVIRGVQMPFDEQYMLLPRDTRYGMYVAYSNTLEYLPVWLLNHVPSVDYHGKMPYMLKAAPPDRYFFVIKLDRKSDETQTCVPMLAPIETVFPNNVSDDQAKAEGVKASGILVE